MKRRPPFSNIKRYVDRARPDDERERATRRAGCGGGGGRPQNGNRVARKASRKEGRRKEGSEEGKVKECSV